MRFNYSMMRGFSTQTVSAAETGLEEEIVSVQDHLSEIAKKLRERYPGVKASRLPKAMFTLDFERDIIPAEEKLINTYGFLKEEINFIMRYNPKFILGVSDVEQDTGIKLL